MIMLMQAGAANPTVGLYVVNVSTPEASKSLDPPADIADMLVKFNIISCTVV